MMASTYEFREDSGHRETLDASSLDEAVEVAEGLLADGEWGDYTGYVDAIVAELDGDGDEVEARTVRVLIEPSEPECSEDAHEWVSDLGGCRENPGVWGLGGAAILSVDHCLHCGTTRRTISGDVNAAGNRNGTRYERCDAETLERLREHHDYTATA